MRAQNTFNVPVAGALLAVEIILGESGVRQFSPIAISSVTMSVQARIDLFARYRQWTALPSSAARCIRWSSAGGE